MSNQTTTHSTQSFPFAEYGLEADPVPLAQQVALNTGPGKTKNLEGNGFKFPLTPSPMNTFGLCGDSNQAHNKIVTATTSSTYAWGPATFANILSRRRMNIISDQSQSSSGVTELNNGTRRLRTQVTALLAVPGIRNIACINGLNDVEAGVPLAAMQSEYLYCMYLALAQGKNWWIITENPIYSGAGNTAYTVARQAQNMEWNRWLRRIVYRSDFTWDRDAVIIVDAYKVIVDPTSATGGFRAGENGNLVDHLNNISGYWAGKEWARILAQKFPEPQILVTSNADAYGYSSVCNNINDNPLFINSAGGLATGYTAAAIGGGTITPSIEAATYGNSQVLDLTFSADLTGGRFTSANYAARVADGDKAFGLCEFEITTPGNLAGPRMTTSFIGANYTKSASELEYNDTVDKSYPEGWIGVYMTDLIQYDATGLYGSAAMGALNQAIIQFSLFGYAAGGAAKVKIRQLSFEVIRNGTLP